MTVQALILEINQLPLSERLELLEAIAHTLQEEFTHTPQGDRRPTLSRMLGILKPNGPVPDDEALEEDYTRYLEKKYS